MSTPFSASSMWPLLPVESWRNYFQCLSSEHQIDINLPWAEIGEDADTLNTAVFKQPISQINIIEQDLKWLHALASEKGIETLIQMAEELKIPFDDSAYSEETEIARALNVRLHWPNLFHESATILSFDAYRWWRKRNDLVRADPHLDTAIFDAMSAEIAEIFKKSQGKGNRCTLKPTRLGDRLFLVAYPDDHVHSITSHDDEGKLRVYAFRPTFLVIFAYDRSTGVLELSSNGGPRLKSKLEKCFARHLLSQELGDWMPTQTYTLLPLIYPDFRLTTHPSEGLSVFLKKLQLDDPMSKRKITLQGDEDHGPHDILEMIPEYFRDDIHLLEAMKISRATFQFFHTARHGRKSGSFSFDVIPPNHCTLRNQPSWRVDMANNKLRSWGIDVSHMGYPLAASRA